MDSDPVQAIQAARNARLADGLAARGARTGNSSGLEAGGTLKRVVGLTLEARGCGAAIGAPCRVEADGTAIEAEVVGFSGDSIFLMPRGDLSRLHPGAQVTPTPRRAEVPLGDALLGRILDAEGQPLDNRGRVRCTRWGSLRTPPINPLLREPINTALDVGVRSINALLTMGRGQRVGLFAGAGVGKSSLLGMMTRHTDADVVVVGMIGERGREVREFVQYTLGEEGLRRAVVVAAPADRPPLTRLRAAYMATAIAEGFRDEGKNVLLLMDSLTRFAQAQREIGLAIGEPPTTRGYPPSVFSQLPQLIERAGNAESGRGTISAIYTVLVEGDDMNDPVGDHARAILDGHIVLSREMADAGLYPAVDFERSISRLASHVQDDAHRLAAVELRNLIGAYRRNRELINVGAYQAGSDPKVDRALELWPRVEAWLGQSMDDRCDLASSVASLTQLISGADSAAMPGDAAAKAGA